MQKMQNLTTSLSPKNNYLANYPGSHDSSRYKQKGSSGKSDRHLHRLPVQQEQCVIRGCCCMQHPSRSFWTTRSGQKHRKLYKKASKKVSQKANKETASRQVHCAYGTQAPACSSKKSATAVAPGKFLVSFSHPGARQFHLFLNPLLSKRVSTQIWSIIKSNLSKAIVIIVLVCLGWTQQRTQH